MFSAQASIRSSSERSINRGSQMPQERLVMTKLSSKWMRGIGIVILIGGLSLTNLPVAAQSGSAASPLTLILEKLNELLVTVGDQTTDLEALQNTTNAVQTTVNGIPSVLLTPELTIFGRAVSCSVVNGSAANAEVQIDLIASNGTVQTGGPRTIPPNAAASVRAANGAFASGLIHCRVTVTQGDKRELRAALCVHEGGSSLDSACMSAVEGR
jgi:hypothetical protein